MTITIRSPQTDEEWSQYYDLRWRILRAPWQQAKGSEKDELEENAVHIAAISDNQVIGVGRMHTTDERSAQIRYMAVSQNYRNKGIGKKILNALELSAQHMNIKHLLLHARENAVSFYRGNQYQLIKQSHILFNKVKHFQMEKDLEQQ